MKKYIIPLSLISLFALSACQKPPEEIKPIPVEEAKKAIQIDIAEPAPGATISSPVAVSGEVRGNWSFEAFFSAKVTDMEGNLLGESPIQLQGDWMTTELVPFAGTITFDKGEATEGKLVFVKSNPSGLPENEDSYSILVKF